MSKCWQLVSLLFVAGLVSTGNTQEYETQAPQQESLDKKQETPEEKIARYHLNTRNQLFMAKIRDIMSNPQFQKELEIPDYQLAKLKQIATDNYQKIHDFTSEHRLELTAAQLQVASGENRKEALEVLKGLQDKLFDISSAGVAEIEEILLPHQIQRFGQIARQNRLIAEAGDEFGVPYLLSTELGLSVREKRNLKKLTTEARKVFYEDLEKLKRKTHEKIAAGLSEEQKKKMAELVGETYDAASERREFLQSLKELEKKDK